MLLALVGVFIVGAILGYLMTMTLPGLALVKLYQQWGILGLIGRVAIALMLIGIPLTYTAWIIGGIVQTSRPRQPMENESLPGLLKEKGEFQHVLVPTGGGPHALLGLRLATKLSSSTGRVTLLRVIPPSAESELADQRRILRRMIEENIGSELEIDIRVRTHTSVIHAIRDEVHAGDYDLLVIGASNRSTIASLLFGTIPDALGEQITCPILVVRAEKS